MQLQFLYFLAVSRSDGEEPEEYTLEAPAVEEVDGDIDGGIIASSIHAKVQGRLIVVKRSGLYTYQH